LYKIKTAVNKISYPDPKQIFRFYNNIHITKDIIALEEEKIETATPLLIQYLNDGQLIQKLPSLVNINEYYEEQISSLPEELKMIINDVKEYPVFFSTKL
jgi:nicotinate phosphoribosyltransferase